MWLHGTCLLQVRSPLGSAFSPSLLGNFDVFKIKVVYSEQTDLDLVNNVLIIFIINQPSPPPPPHNYLSLLLVLGLFNIAIIIVIVFIIHFIIGNISINSSTVLVSAVVLVTVLCLLVAGIILLIATNNGCGNVLALKVVSGGGIMQWIEKSCWVIVCGDYGWRLGEWVSEGSWHESGSLRLPIFMHLCYSSFACIFVYCFYFYGAEKEI